jgi:hypothetical protein
MNDNKYVEKFQNKTDAELEYILENNEKYNEQAVFASIEILKDRNGKSPELESVESEIEVAKERKIVAQRKAIEEDKKKSNITNKKHYKPFHMITGFNKYGYISVGIILSLRIIFGPFPALL